ncbi:MAG: GntR family transcriptional regulator [Anaerolineae bacterium]
MRQIDKDSPVPYYAQVKEALQARIRQGEWQAGDQLPGEPELCRIFDVSRTVIRQALNELWHEGLIVRRKGRGTFVAEPKIRGSLVQKLTGFHEDMVSQGYTPVTQTLQQESVPAPPKVAQYLNIEAGTPVIEIERLRFVLDEPVVLVTTYIPHALCPDLLHADLSQQSLYAFLERQCGLTIAHGRRSIEAVPANAHEARLLRIKQGAPLILLDSVSYLSDGTAIEYYHALHRGDRSRFEVELVRVQEQGSTRTVLGPAPGTFATANRAFSAPLGDSQIEER